MTRKRAPSPHLPRLVTWMCLPNTVVAREARSASTQTSAPVVPATVPLESYLWNKGTRTVF